MSTETCRGAARVLALAIAALALPAAACGICIEDRVAAVYDQMTVDRAVERRQQVAFFALNGSVEATPQTRRAVIAALDRAGIKGTVHVSLESATASVAYDPARTTVASLAKAGDRALASRSLTLEALRITGPDGKLREP